MRKSARYREDLAAATAVWKDVAAAKAIDRTGKYIGRMRRQPGVSAKAAAALLAAAAAGPAPVYVWPTVVPQGLPTSLMLDLLQLRHRDSILDAIEAGKEDLAATHVALAAVVPAAATAAAVCRDGASGASAVAAVAAVAEPLTVPAAAATEQEPAAAAAAAVIKCTEWRICSDEQQQRRQLVQLVSS
jgi:hypothetical protein